MSNDELDAIEARAKKATPGPWLTCVIDEGQENACVQHRHHDLYREVTECAPTPGQGPNHFTADMSKREALNVGCMLLDNDRDAEFIAHARGDIAALVAEVRRLRERDRNDS